MPFRKFDYTIDFTNTDFREHPELYSVGKGEQGVLLVQPYKGEILPFWKFRTPEIAEVSAKKIYHLFLQYGKQNDFVGMDMARKFLQMGFTRSRRYANHKSGKKYDGPVPADKKGVSGAHGRSQLPRVTDEVKAQSAIVFSEYLEKAKKNTKYKQLKQEHQSQYES